MKKGCKVCEDRKRIKVLDGIVNSLFEKEEYMRAVKYYNEMKKINDNIGFCCHDYVFIENVID